MDVPGSLCEANSRSQIQDGPHQFACISNDIISQVKLGIVFKEDNKIAQESTQKAIEFLNSKGAEILKDEKDFKKADYIVIFGGDGTLIHTASRYIELEVPFVGVNSGNLGFLTAVENADWRSAMENLVSAKVFLSERITLEAKLEVTGSVYRAINEAAIKSFYRMSEVQISIDGTRFLKVLGDGVIIATQTGSTAYSLSSGGPIVDSDLDSFLVTPINPIGLPIPSVVLSPQKKIKVKVIRGDDVSLIIDGREHTKLKEGDEVSLWQGEYKVKFGYFDKQHFLKSLNAKFGLAERIAG